MKVPFSFGLSFFLRVLIPGFFFSIFTYPLIYPIIISFFESTAFSFLADAKLFLLIESILVGIMTNALDYRIYQIYEGRIFWPKFAFDFGIKREEKYIQKLKKNIEKEEIKNQENSASYLESWYKLRLFPQNKNSEYEAIYPTRLGNIIHGYETYSKSRHGVDSVFWWYRIWLSMDKEIREELDQFSAKADFSVYSSIIFLVSFILNLFGFVLFFFYQNQNAFNSISQKTLLLLSISSLLISIIFYKMSKYTHRLYGEYFKSVFDINKAKVLALDSPLSEEDKEKIIKIARFLQYYKIRCPNCNHLNSGNAKECSECGGQF